MSAASEIRLERLLGREVFDDRGRCVGRLEEVRAERRDGEWVVVACLIGTSALLERMAARVLKLFGVWSRGYQAGWDQIDWESGEELRLLCPVEDLRRFTRRGSKARK